MATDKTDNHSNNDTFRIPNESEWYSFSESNQPEKTKELKAMFEPEKAMFEPEKAMFEPEKAMFEPEKTRQLKDMLLASLQMSNVIVLAGSGTSMRAGGPSMTDLWKAIIKEDPMGAGEPSMTNLWGGIVNCENDKPESDKAKEIINKVGYQCADQNIETLLSHCEAYLQVHQNEEVSQFVNDAKKTILEKCNITLQSPDSNEPTAHETFLHRLSRRRTRDPRLKIFTTNYDLCFEQAAAKQGLIPIDGFSFSRPRTFDPRFFNMDIVRRPRTTSDHSDYVEGIFQLLKLHGSVNWEKKEDGRIEENESVSPEKACLVYPAKGKYQHSFIQPHLELISQFFSALREPQTCLITIGYGFNDDHLSEPILSAVTTNPHFRLIVVDRAAQSKVDHAAQSKVDPAAKSTVDHAAQPTVDHAAHPTVDPAAQPTVDPAAQPTVDPAAQPTVDHAAQSKVDHAAQSNYWKKFANIASSGGDVWMINATFEAFSTIIPDLNALSPAQKLASAIQEMT